MQQQEGGSQAIEILQLRRLMLDNAADSYCFPSPRSFSAFQYAASDQNRGLYWRGSRQASDDKGEISRKKMLAIRDSQLG